MLSEALTKFVEKFCATLLTNRPLVAIIDGAGIRKYARRLLAVLAVLSEASPIRGRASCSGRHPYHQATSEKVYRNVDLFALPIFVRHLRSPFGGREGDASRKEKKQAGQEKCSDKNPSGVGRTPQHGVAVCVRVSAHGRA